MLSAKFKLILIKIKEISCYEEFKAVKKLRKKKTFCQNTDVFYLITFQSMEKKHEKGILVLYLIYTYIHT